MSLPELHGFLFCGLQNTLAVGQEEKKSEAQQKKIQEFYSLAVTEVSKHTCILSKTHSTADCVQKILGCCPGFDWDRINFILNSWCSVV